MTPSPPPTATTEEAADHGCVLGAIGNHRQLLSHADAWREGDVYILRSTEFDVIAEHEDFDQALDRFVAWLFDYAAHLADLVNAGDATDDERETSARLSARILRFLQEAERQEDSQRQEDRRRHAQRRRRANIWRHQGTQVGSSGRLSTA